MKPAFYTAQLSRLDHVGGAVAGPGPTGVRSSSPSSCGNYPLVAVLLDDHDADAPEGGSVLMMVEPVIDLAPEQESEPL